MPTKKMPKVVGSRTLSVEVAGVQVSGADRAKLRALRAKKDAILRKYLPPTSKKATEMIIEFPDGDTGGVYLDPPGICMP